MAASPVNPTDAQKIADLETQVASLQDQLAKCSSLPEKKPYYDAARMAYAEYGNQIRHFSTIRSSLTVFLLTVGMTAYATYLDKKFPFLRAASLVFAAASLVACLRFSFLTEENVLRYKETFKLLNGEPSRVNLRNLKFRPPAWEIWQHMLFGSIGKPVFLPDIMNWLLIIPIVFFFFYALSHPASIGPA